MIKFFKLHGNRCPDPAATRMVKASQDLMGKKLAQYIKQINGTEEAMLVQKYAGKFCFEAQIWQTVLNIVIGKAGTGLS